MPHACCLQGRDAIMHEQGLFAAFEMLFDTPLLTTLRALIGRSERVSILEAGSGTGRLALKIQRQHPQVYIQAVDIDPIQLASARYWAALEGAGEAVHFIEADLSDGLSFVPDQSLDIYLSNHGINAVVRSTLPAVLEDACRMVKPGGWFLALLPWEGRGNVPYEYCYREILPRQGFQMNEPVGIRVPVDDPLIAHTAVFKNWLSREVAFLVCGQKKEPSQLDFTDILTEYMGASLLSLDHIPDGLEPSLADPGFITFCQRFLTRLISEHPMLLEMQTFGDERLSNRKPFLRVLHGKVQQWQAVGVGRWKETESRTLVRHYWAEALAVGAAEIKGHDSVPFYEARRKDWND